MEKKRIRWIDMAKGIGMLMVLINHAELNLGPVNWLGGMFYMPVFFVVAGMTFSMKDGESLGSFALRKAKRLLIPYFVYNLFLFVIFFCKDNLLGGNTSGKSFFPLLGILYSRNCLYPMSEPENMYLMTILNAPTWFLTCMFLVLILFAVIWKLSRRSRRAAYGVMLACVAAAVVLQYVCPILLPWSLDCVFYAVVFVGVGYLIRKKNVVERVYEKKGLLAGLIAIFVILAGLNGSVNMSVAEYGRSMLLYLAVGSLGSLLCLELTYGISLRAEKKDQKGLAEILVQAGVCIGSFTLRILCLHLFVFMIVKTAAGFLPYVGTEGPFIKSLMIAASILLLVPGKLKGKLEAMLWVLLFTWYLPIINKGIDVQDTTFYLTNYRYAFTPSVKVNELYYLFGEVLGGIVYHLFPGHALLALNYTCAAVYTGVALLVYYKLKDRMARIPLLLCVLGGSIFAITWVHCVNWNAWSVLFGTLGAWLLLWAVQQEKKKVRNRGIAGAGFLLGLNAFVRMPNILFLSLAAVVFWYEWFHCEKDTKEKLGQRLWNSVKGCLPMVAGGALAGILGVLISIGLLGLDKFVEDFMVLTVLGAEGDLHSITTGIYQFVIGVKDGILVWLRYGVVLALAALLLGLLKKNKNPETG